MEFIKTFIYGLVEGITEWLPVSSTGHLILLNSVMPLDISAKFFYVFKVVIQLGAILAVVINFWEQLWPFDKYEKNYIKKDIVTMWCKIIVACMPAAIVGLLLDDYVEKYFSSNLSVSIALIAVGIVFIIVEVFNKKEPKINSIKDISYKTAIAIGGFQLIAAIFPGVSRSGATIIGALLVGVSRAVAVEFSFFMAVPVMFGASLIRLIRVGFSFTEEELAILSIGMFGAFLISNIVINVLISFVMKHDFKGFAYYRIALGILVLVFCFI